ncbi:MAG: metal-sulfur cluster assembly factor [Pseudorhodoplanes sp.]|jgi:metal-sulfur cluster biosynthetic enzyme|nr:metal-sulfur cluster assembly factor [Pseudorhodoplanes sp.]
MSTDVKSDLADEVRNALRTVIDPELGFNIVDLGLIYSIAVESDVALITMTTTTRGCPATSFLKEGARESASTISGVKTVDVTLTYDPPWTPEMMSAEAKKYLGVADGVGW